MDEDWYEHEQLQFAAREGDIDCIRELLALGFPVRPFDDLGNTPLHYAASNEQYDAAELLITSGADVNAHDEKRIGETPLGEVAATCSLRGASLLVKAGADPTIPSWMHSLVASSRETEAG